MAGAPSPSAIFVPDHPWTAPFGPTSGRPNALLRVCRTSASFPPAKNVVFAGCVAGDNASTRRSCASPSGHCATQSLLRASPGWPSMPTRATHASHPRSRRSSRPPAGLVFADQDLRNAREPRGAPPLDFNLFVSQLGLLTLRLGQQVLGQIELIRSGH